MTATDTATGNSSKIKKNDSKAVLYFSYTEWEENVFRFLDHVKTFLMDFCWLAQFILFGFFD